MVFVMIQSSCPLCGSALGDVLVRIDTPDRFEQQAGISPDGYAREWRACSVCTAACDVHLSPEAQKLERWATDYYEVEDVTEPLEQTGWMPLDLQTIVEPSGKISSTAFACLSSTAKAAGKRAFV